MLLFHPGRMVQLPLRPVCSRRSRIEAHFRHQSTTTRMFCRRRVLLDAFRAGSRVTRRLSSSVSTDVKPYYVTTPIFYPNASVSFLRSLLSPKLRIGVRVAPHVGHLYTLVTADIFARYNQLSNANRPVQFVTGTDEHGLKIQRAAQGASREPQVFCDGLSAEFRVCLLSLVNSLLCSS